MNGRDSTGPRGNTGPRDSATPQGSAAPQVTAVVPTVGASPYLAACLDALRSDGGDAVQIVVVAQGRGRRTPSPHPLAAKADLWLEVAGNLGFTGGTNAGIQATATGGVAYRGTPYVATVNDDAVVHPGWTAALIDALAADPGAAAAQGINLAGVPRTATAAGGPRTVDGWGLTWNRWWQAVQLGHGEAAEAAPTAAREVFGVSATAAIYRRQALEQVAGADGAVFDPRLVSWYEDADLAVRLRRAGWRALSVPAARADHAGGATAGRRPRAYGSLLYGNRWLVAAALLGRRFPLAVPRLLARDLADLAGAPRRLPNVAGGWLRAASRLPGWLHCGPALDSDL